MKRNLAFHSYIFAVALPALIAVSSCSVTNTPTSRAHNLSTAKETSALPAEKQRKRTILTQTILDNPNQLKKLSAEDAVLLFNEPDLMRKEMNNVALQFRSPSCVMSLYYQNGAQKPSHTELRAAQSQNNSALGNIDTKECLQSLL